MFDKQIAKDSDYITTFEDGETREMEFDLASLKVEESKKFVGRITYPIRVKENDEIGWKTWSMSEALAKGTIKVQRQGYLSVNSQSASQCTLSFFARLPKHLLQIYSNSLLYPVSRSNFLNTRYHGKCEAKSSRRRNSHCFVTLFVKLITINTFHCFMT